MTTETIPAEWNDPHAVMPHLAEQCRQWTIALQQLDQDLAVVQGAVDPGEHLSAIAHEARRIQLQEWLTTIRAQLLELTHQVGNRAQVYQTVAEELGKEAST